MTDKIETALKKAYLLGQTFMQQADSESYAQNRRAFETQARFDALVSETVALLREAAQPETAGEEVMVNTPYDVFTLPLQPSGLSSGPRFVVHVPAPEPQPSLMDGATYRCRKCGEQNEIMLNSARIVTRLRDGSPRDPRDIESDPAGTLIHDPAKPLYAAPVAAQPEPITPKQLARLIADNPDVQFSVKPRPADEELRRDAERYRWLRDPCCGAERVIFYCRGDYGRGLMSGTMLDAAIDEAMEKGGQ